MFEQAKNVHMAIQEVRKTEGKDARKARILASFATDFLEELANRSETIALAIGRKVSRSSTGRKLTSPTLQNVVPPKQGGR